MKSIVMEVTFAFGVTAIRFAKVMVRHVIAFRDRLLSCVLEAQVELATRSASAIDFHAAGQGLNMASSWRRVLSRVNASAITARKAS